MKSGSLGIVNPKVFFEVMQKARHGQEVPLVRLLRTVGIEVWLRNLSKWGAVVGRDRNTENLLSSSTPPVISAEKY